MLPGQATREGGTKELSFAISGHVSSFSEFQIHLFLEARTRKGSEGGLSRLECLEMSLNAALFYFILHFLKEA